MNCPTHDKPPVRTFQGTEIYLCCRNERKREFYDTNPFHVFGKGKSRKQAQRHTYETKKQRAAAKERA